MENISENEFLKWLDAEIEANGSQDDDMAEDYQSGYYTGCASALVKAKERYLQSLPSPKPDHIHVSLPSGGVANVSPDASPELLGALDQMVELAKKMPDAASKPVEQTEMPEGIDELIELMWKSSEYRTGGAPNTFRSGAIAMYQRDQEQIKSLQQQLSSCQEERDDYKTLFQKSDESVDGLISRMAKAEEERDEYRSLLETIFDGLSLEEKQQVAPVLDKYPKQ